MEWPVNALFVLLGALLTWITPHGVKLRWARVVAVCLGLRVRLEPDARGAPAQADLVLERSVDLWCRQQSSVSASVHHE